MKSHTLFSATLLAALLAVNVGAQAQEKAPSQTEAQTATEKAPAKAMRHSHSDEKIGVHRHMQGSEQEQKGEVQNGGAQDGKDARHSHSAEKLHR